jgi:uncharacterized protein (TIGR02118 family)
MIKLVHCITRRPGMTRAEFSHYWKHVHGPIGARIPGLRRLVQSHATTSPGDRPRPDFDGMAELWFDDWDALREARRATRGSRRNTQAGLLPWGRPAHGRVRLPQAN